MRFFLAAFTVLFSSSAFAVNHCDDYVSRAPRFLEAIRAVADYRKQSFDELCNLPGLLDIEAQPSRVILRDGTVIPHVSVQLHRAFDTCEYKVRDADKAITEGHCYSGE